MNSGVQDALFHETKLVVAQKWMHGVRPHLDRSSHNWFPGGNEEEVGGSVTRRGG